jgi:hypothetical protein
LTDAHLECIAQHGSNLEVLHIQSCQSITAKGMKALLQSKNLRRLTRIVASENIFNTTSEEENARARAEIMAMAPKHLYLDM